MPFPSHVMPVASRAGHRFDWQVARDSARQDAPIHLTILVLAVMAAAVTGGSAAAWAEMLVSQMVDFALLCLVTLVAMRFFGYVATTRPARPIRQLAADAHQAVERGFLERRLPLAVSIAVFIAAFTRFKGAIPVLADGFGWDAAFAALDRRIHFGVQPWEWLQPVLGTPFVTFLLNVNYNLWFFFMWGMVFGFAFGRSGMPGRTRFLLAFLLIWSVAGCLLAVAFSSAGPCYYGLVVAGPDPYAGLMAYLRRADAAFPLWALRVQDILWADYRSGAGAIGISAMPSLHNATALLMVLAARDLAPRLRPWLILHMALVFVGSIHLGWHYAVDAYLAFAVTAAIWFAVSPFARRWDARFSTANV